jgi:hypothetical protein
MILPRGTAGRGDRRSAIRAREPVIRPGHHPPGELWGVNAMNREQVLAWFRAHRGRTIRLGRAGSTLKVIGRTQGVDEIDACSADILETELETGLPGVQVALTFHEDALALHLLVAQSGSKDVACSLPLSLPYEQLRLSEAPAGESGEGPEDQEEFSPYALLFARSD